LGEREGRPNRHVQGWRVGGGRKDWNAGGHERAPKKTASARPGGINHFRGREK